MRFRLITHRVHIQAGLHYTFAFLSLLKKATVVTETSRTIFFSPRQLFFLLFFTKKVSFFSGRGGGGGGGRGEEGEMSVAGDTFGSIVEYYNRTCELPSL